MGLPEVILTEVMAAPSGDGSEWVELLAVGDEPVELSDYRLCDDDGTPRALPSWTLAPGSRVVLVQSFDAFHFWWQGLQAAGADWPCPVVEPLHFATELPGTWPTLNNTSTEGRDRADRVHLLDESGIVIDHATVGGAGLDVRRDRSLERTGTLPSGHALSLWGTCTAIVGSTPGCANSLEARIDGDGLFTVGPLPAGAEGGAVFSFLLTAGERSWRLRIYDLRGHLLRDLGGDALGPGPRRLVWDGSGDDGRLLPAGPAVALLTVTGADGARLRGHKALLVVPPGGRS